MKCKKCSTKIEGTISGLKVCEECFKTYEEPKKQIDNKVKDYLERARQITRDMYPATQLCTLENEIEIAKMIQIEEVLNSKIVKGIQRFIGI